MSHTPRSLDRRAFLSCAANAFAGVIVAQPLTYARERAPAPRLRLSIVAGRNAEYATSSMGVELGIDEAKRAASLLGGSVEVVDGVDSVANALVLVRRERPSALLCAATADDVAELGRECASLSTPMFNLAADDDSLRNQRCSRFTFHVCASDAVRRGARASLAGSSAPSDTTIELWSSRLERYGAAQLNDRFQSRFRRPMDSPAWAGWFAVKVVWEASLRARTSDGSAIAAYLERDTTQFDGQKGVPLSFRQWDHQLRQPLYAVSASPASEPISVPASPASSRAELDMLGTTREASSCHWR